MPEALLVFCNCGSKAEADRIASSLVEERLAACVNILPPVQSVYRWRGAVERAEEIPLLIKTTRDRFSALRDRIETIHSYDTPEIVAVPIVEGSERYLAWLRTEVQS
jgi:periplasmic divalent cation tolerance protein